ncbi:MAG: nucleotide sugar dehydrogenase [Streptosporangiales bacterium]|nr:nucleotide sugar dehydrogenase [Streptosporangiales bacterium]
MRVAVFGVGYVGSVTAACLAAHGHDVWGVDVDAGKVDAINAGRSPVIEPGLAEMISAAVVAGNLHATTDPQVALDGADLSLVCVPTPSTSTGSTDLSYVQSAVDGIARALTVARPAASDFHAVVVRSTVPPGTVENVVAPALPAESAGAGMCPEFLREGSGVADFFDPPFVVVGTPDERVGKVVTELFGFLDRSVRVVDVRSAEALKYACNAFHATKVSFANEMGRMFRPFGVDTREVMELFCTDTRLNISPTYLRPGFAFGGSCLPKDLRSLLYLARMNSADMPLLAGTLASNERVVHEVVDRVVATDAQVVALLGLSFKSATDDLRESPSVELAERLIGKGYELRIYDALVNPARLIGANRKHVESKLPHLRRLFTDGPLEALRGADVALVSSTDPAVLDALVANPPRRVVDLSGRLGDDVEALAGYEGVGW